MSDVFTLAESENILTTKTAIKKLILDKHIFRGQSGQPQGDVVIAGGFFATMLKLEPYNDVDVFILNNNQMLYDHLTYKNDPDPTGSVWNLRQDGGAYLKNPRIKSLATNRNTKVQYILTDFRTRKELLADFDFVHCTVSYDATSDNLFITREAYDCIVKKELRNNKKDEPAMWRKDKFLSRGWSYVLALTEPKTSWIDDIMQKHGKNDAVLAYKTK